MEDKILLLFDEYKDLIHIPSFEGINLVMIFLIDGTCCIKKLHSVSSGDGYPEL